MGSNNRDVSKWLKENLQEVMPCLVSPDIIQLIMTIENDRDLEDYMSTLLDTSSPKYRTFLANYKRIRSIKDGKDDSRKLDEFSRKQKEADKKNKKKGNYDTSLKDRKNSNSSVNVHSDASKDKEEKQAGRKKKTKFINLYSHEGEQKDVVFLKGRHPCECQASKHSLVNNCLKCGRIVCQQEGSGPCFFCNAMVFSRKEQNAINSNSLKSRKLYDNIMESIKSEEFEKSIERRNRLLEYDKTSAQRTKVTDDEGDYYSSNSVWLSKEEKEKLERKEAEAHARRHGSRLQKKFTLDFAGRTVVEEETPELGEELYSQALEKIEEVLSESYQNPDIAFFLQPLYQCPDSTSDGSKQEKRLDYSKVLKQLLNYKVQDRELLEMSDQGVCLSIHQPWASLLVCGIKRHEGRSWYTSHRGRLWIAATSKHPTAEDIEEAESVYQFLVDEDLTFPKSYPSSCLLGCVSVIDCLPQEEYRLRFPEGECDSPFVFVCEDPRQLDIFFPMSGSHKIYKLDSKIHQAANKALMRMARKAES